MKRVFPKVLLLTLIILPAAAGCRTKLTRQLPANSGDGGRGGDNPSSRPVPVYGYDVVNVWPHDNAAFTQGLIFYQGTLFESTGQYGKSSLRRVELQTGKVLDKVDIPGQHFAEGITLLNGKIFQLTWTSQKCFVYDPASLEKIGEFSYAGQGWGLTHDGHLLILSDGTNQLRFIDPATFETKRAISVSHQGRLIKQLNELEYIKGEIYANVWHTDSILRIDPQTGVVRSRIDLKGLLPAHERSDDEAVLNGIAYDEVNDRLFVTGKLWPKLFEIRVKQ